MKMIFRVLFKAIFFCLYSVMLNAQDKNSIINSGQYFYGESTASYEEEASDNAFIIAANNILVNVTLDFKKQVVDNNGDSKGKNNTILLTYKSAFLKNAKTLKSLADNKVDVFHYISKNDVNNIFNERKKFIVDIFKKAEQFESEMNIGYALKGYYYAIILINSLPDSNLLTDDINLYAEISKRITEIIKSTKFILKSDRLIAGNEREIILDIKTNEKPIRSVDFSIRDGMSKVNVRGTDGEGIIRLNNSNLNTNELYVDIEYSFLENKDEIEEIEKLWNLVEKPVFKNSIKIISAIDEIINDEQKKNDDSERSVSIDPSKVVAYSNEHFKIQLANKDNCDVMDKIGMETLALTEIINSNNISTVQEKYSHDPFLIGKITDILKLNNTSIVGFEIEASVNKTINGWEVRKISILNKYKSLKKQSKEYLVLDYDINGNLEDLSFGAFSDNFEYIKKQAEYGKDWINRLTLLKFIERYRTCFLTRDSNTLDSLFSDQAVIIVGRILKKADSNEMIQYIKLNKEQPEASYIQYTKKEYMNNLARLFKRPQDIFLGFSSLDISKKNGQEMVYGISMRQNYYSTTYSDEGYLFLLVDFYYKFPQIYVRSWQPGEWSEDAIVRLSNFSINRAE